MKTILKIIFCLTLFSCSGSNDNNEAPAVTEGYFQAKIEGVEKKVKNWGNTHYVEWRKSKDSHDRYYYGVHVYGFDQGFYLDCKIYTENIELNKEYTYVYTNDFSNLNMDFDYSEPCGAPTCSSYWGCSNNFYGNPSGKMIITSFDGKKMSGKVETKVNHQYYGMTTHQTRTITEGIFVNAEKATGSL